MGRVGRWWWWWGWGRVGVGGRWSYCGPVAATVWSFYEFRRRRKPSWKKGIWKDFQTPNLGKVKNVDGGDEVDVILQNSKFLIDVDKSQTEEKDASAQNLLLDVEKRSELESIDIKEEEESREGRNIEVDESIDGSMVLFQKEAVSVHEMMHEGVDFCVDSLDAYTSSSVSEDDSSVSNDELAESKDDGIMLVEKKEVTQFATENFADADIKKGDNFVHFKASEMIVDDESNDALSKDLEYEAEYGSEKTSRGTSDSSVESNAEATWPVEALSETIEDEKKLTSIQKMNVVAEDSNTKNSVNGIYHKESEIIEAEDREIMSSANSESEVFVADYCETGCSSDGIHHNGSEIVEADDSETICSNNDIRHNENENVETDRSETISSDSDIDHNVIEIVEADSRETISSANGIHPNKSDIVEADSSESISSANGIHPNDSAIVETDNDETINSVNGIHHIESQIVEADNIKTISSADDINLPFHHNESWKSEGCSSGTLNSSAESNEEAALLVESSEGLSESIECEENLTSIQKEIVEAEDRKTTNSINDIEMIDSAKNIHHSENKIVEADYCEKNNSPNGTHHIETEIVEAEDSEIVQAEDNEIKSSSNVLEHNHIYEGNVSSFKEGLGSTVSHQMVGNSTNKFRICASTVLLALLVLLGALLAQHNYFSSALADNLSSLSSFLMK